MNRVLVTGAAGFIGSTLVDRLLATGREVLGVDSFTSYYARELKEQNLSEATGHKGFRLVEGDLLDLDLGPLLAETDAVVHLAAEPGVRSSWGENFPRYLRRNVEVTQRLLEALAQAGLKRLVFASSSSVYGSAGEGPVSEEAPKLPASPYGFTKLAAEELVHLYRRQSDLPVTMLRYFTVYGPRQRPEMALARFISAATSGERIEVFGTGEQVREMTYVGDVVEATVAALEAPVGTYNVGGGSRASVNELVDHVRRALGTEVSVRNLPPVAGDVRSTWADPTRSREVLGFEPQVGLEEGIGAQVEWTLRTRLAPGSARN
ncbi:Nucleoside-diphosphate-sugar epimerase [Rubrobacter radiotolerans]|uniref:Nucleoside-diphosphate-sugar epimerase n=1 Tax=Rubrobacter radiotolerans TaxID=42256 RepID=A0A023X253_RUBRA|nr:Nucleoside-diphosphate-sugar epimerase [Rubrobacter radiotolerans]SMC03953.1 Nucleoside-diphosphate-sugar epimerase [Rubrobacter radiotolerans DSM 5868]